MIWILLVGYQLKHWVCDYLFQNKYMLGKFQDWPKWVLPLTAHSAVHGVATFIVAMMIKPDIAIFLAAFDFSTHFIVDRLKASPKLGGRFKSLDKVGYRIAVNMSNGLGCLTGERLPDYFPSETEENYKALGIKDLRGNKYFWWILGLDQMAHHLTHYYIIYSLLS